MSTKASAPAHKFLDTGETAEPGHAAWKRRKVELGVEQAKGREAMIPAETVWRDLGLED